MIEIKFRGKRVDNGQWVYGDLIQSRPSNVDGKWSSWIIEKSIMPFGARSTPTERFLDVMPDTVCQYTGLKDQNGKEVYEGDICHISGIGNITVVWDDSSLGYVFTTYKNESEFDYQDLLEDIQSLEIIGNIDDMPK